MPTECSQGELDLGRSGGRKLVGAFDGGAITSNGGVALLAAADRSIGLGRRLAHCFTDLRLDPAIRHSVPDLLRQRIFGIALGHEDLIDHDALREDPADRPIGVVFWGFVNDEVEERLKAGTTKLGSQGWKSGDKLWVVEVIAPFGGAEEMVKDLKTKVFPDRDFRYLSMG